MEFPRVLILTSSNFNLVTGTGITLTNLFSGWPAECIANVHEDSQPEDHTVCQRSYRLTSDEIKWIWPLSLIEPGSRPTSAIPTGESASSSAAGLSRRLFGDGIPRKAVVTPALKKWLDSFRPDIIYSHLGSMAQIRIAAVLAAQLRVPLVLHIMDDWPAVIYTQGLFGPLIRQTVMAEFKELLQTATLRMAICDDMCDEYRMRYGLEFLPFHNAINMSEWRSGARRNWQAGSPFVVRYAGSIVPEAQRESLRDICIAVSKLRAAGKNIEIRVHAPANQRAYLAAENHDGLHLFDSPAPSSIVNLLSTADLLVLPFNFESRSAEYMRLSMPTKVPAYMASGTPILVYGPAEIATVKYAAREGWAYVLSEPGVTRVESVLHELMSDERLRELHAVQAQKTASLRHDSVNVRAAFHASLIGAARKLVTR